MSTTGETEKPMKLVRLILDKLHKLARRVHYA